MIAVSLFYLALSLQVGSKEVKSLQVYSGLQASTPRTSSFLASAKRSTNFPLKQANDSNGSVETESSLSLPDEDTEFNWKAIAEYVFDESISVTEMTNRDELEDQPHHHSKPIILFDGICNLCNGGVNFAIDHDKSGRFRFASLQSNVAKSLLLRDGKDPCTTSDIVLVTSEKAYYSSDAVARIMSGLDAPILKILGVFGQISPSFARNAVYRVISGNRFILGENDSCRMDFDGEYTSRFVSDPPGSMNVDNGTDDTDDKEDQ